MVHHICTYQHTARNFKCYMEKLVDALAKHYPKYAQRLCSLYELANGSEPTWEGLSKISLVEFVAALTEQVSRNSAKTYAAMFKAVLNLYSEEVQLPKDYDKVLSLKAEGVAPTWLNEEEVQKLIDFKTTDEMEQAILNQFLLGCLTGARHSDYTWFTKRNIDGENLVYVSQKTKTRTVVPLSPAVVRILEEGNIQLQVADSTFNSKIRGICRKAGVNAITSVFLGGQEQSGEKWRFVASHTARRTFATNVYLRCRDIFLVSKYMGHASVDMTAKYILSIGDAPAEVREYFEKFN